MNRDNFPTELKRLREERNLSQEDMATLLANSHRVFDGVNQVTISKWERGDTKTSLLRRLGISSYLSIQYEYDAKELDTLSPSIKLSDIPVNQDISYSYSIDSVDCYTTKSIPSESWNDILAIHSKLYSLDFMTFYNADHLSVDDIVILVFYCKGLMVGHILYDDRTNMLLSIGSISLSIRKQVLQYMAESITKKSFIIPVHDPAMAQFLYDLYLEPKRSMFGLFLFTVEPQLLATNPFYQNLSENGDQSFKYFRYYSQKSKKKSIEFLL
ncbi:helix-turn-helix domain-containing protein [Agarivorans sp. 1_MG-2023]|uniref:helix-turn-helix domain-containing protein n=1 Tax=Agarivorans sp. 1_MG-2023 TaxID=3062634 RepID=UPI0026E2762D|nr:helix-turn-helix domain-containing protein [Agarivorans sp. 1_MG-2023]MDO6764669.1 helix-turn-helix domain-containing protein [Agarivorans sp. 1_MG-2023]